MTVLVGSVTSFIVGTSVAALIGGSLKNHPGKARYRTAHLKLAKSMLLVQPRLGHSDPMMQPKFYGPMESITGRQEIAVNASALIGVTTCYEVYEVLDEAKCWEAERGKHDG